MSTALWQVIHDQLVAEISEGRLGPAAKLPTEAALAARFAVNRHTVRRAIAAMREAGLVHSRRGAGVFVAAAPVAYRLGQRTRFTQPLAEQGHASARRILRLDTMAASKIEAEHLQIAAGAPVLVMEGVGEIDGHPATHGHSVFPEARLPGLKAALLVTTSVTLALQRIGVPDYARAWTRISAERASGVLARHLQVAEGAPLIRTHSLNVDPAQRPIELGRTHFCADRVELLVEQD